MSKNIARTDGEKSAGVNALWKQRQVWDAIGEPVPGADEIIKQAIAFLSLPEYDQERVLVPDNWEPSWRH